jgi:hypothetical protein
MEVVPVTKVANDPVAVRYLGVLCTRRDHL